MFHRSQGRAILTGLIVLAVPLCLPKITRADDKAECGAAWADGYALQKKGDYPAAVKAYERALELASRVFGVEDTNTVALLNNLAILYANMGQYAKAEPL